MNPTDAWNAAFSQLEMQLDRATFHTWLRDARLLNVREVFPDPTVFVIGVRNSYAVHELQYRLYRNIQRVLRDSYGQAVELEFQIHKAEPVQEAPQQEEELPLLRLISEAQHQPEIQPVMPLHRHVARPQRPELPDSEINPRYTFDRFVTGNENPLVYPAARAVADYPGATYNPLLIYGGVGLGKTHLLQAIAHVCRDKCLRAIYISSEAFTNDLVDAIRHKTTAMFREKYRSADVLLVDDIQFLAGKDNTQEEFFHTFNQLHMYNKQIVMASDRHPSQMEGVVDRLRSRFQSGLLVDVQVPAFETRVAILQMWATERGLKLPNNVAELLANRARTNIRELESVFNQVAASAQLSRYPVEMESAIAALDGLRRPRHYISLNHVLTITARHYNVTITDLIGTKRSADISQARQIAMYLAREMTRASLGQIGEALGGRTHSTVLHSCNKIAADIQDDPMVSALVKTIRERLMTDFE